MLFRSRKIPEATFLISWFYDRIQLRAIKRQRQVYQTYRAI